jgi:methionyl-tRNA formyltransferase
MRIEFLTQEDPLYILPFFEDFLKNYARDFEILQISCCPTMGKRPRLQLLRELTSLYGFVGMIRLLSFAVRARVLGKLARDRSSQEFYSLEQIARAYNIPYQKIGNPNSSEFVESVRRRGADAIVSVACPFILKDTLLSVPPRGCVNIHHAPLPRYKGMMPTFWQMFHGEKSVGVTVHFMAAKVDEGAALLQDKLDIEPGETLHNLIRRSKRHGAHCMARVLREISSETHSTRPLTEKGSYFTFPTIAEIREFHNRGFRSI